MKRTTEVAKLAKGIKKTVFKIIKRYRHEQNLYSDRSF